MRGHRQAGLALDAMYRTVDKRPNHQVEVGLRSLCVCSCVWGLAPILSRRYRVEDRYAKTVQLTTQLIDALPEAALEGKTISGDALYSNKNLVREIVQERGGEVLVQLKVNQKTTLEEATRRLNQSAPSFYTQTQNSAMDA